MDDKMALTELADLLGMLGHPDRLRLLLELRSEARDVASLVTALGASQSRTSQHLGLLKAHHLVVAERQGRQVFYRLRDEALPSWFLGGLDFLDTGPSYHAPLAASIAALRQPDD